MAEASKTLFVRNLSWFTDDNELRAYFEQFGPTERCEVARDRETNKSRGFGFVTFENLEDCEKSLAVEHELNDRAIYAQISVPRERPPQRQFDDDREMETHKLYCGNLPESVGSMDLGQHFQELAEVVDATVMMDRETGRSRGFGFVEFNETVELSTMAEILSQEHSFEGRNINVRAGFKRVEYPREDNFGGGGGGDFNSAAGMNMFKTSMPTPGSPGWPGMTSFGGVRTFSTMSAAPIVSQVMRPRVSMRAPAMRVGPAMRSIMMKIVR